ncbi:MBL fold metallo-hydrolase [Actinoallomurus soli]|uniref:MBL fold metallo-hydrolase n=1 Tax=Actinoallomurus soli TaxID=2952535 RepID=UPI002092E1E2|nr:MBL fold metallo-hydrolase [Actinoallomurus soli]MCO5972972.1 MBL fold metallo-hydrolase [Actinoallomurus soli]
MRLTKLGHACIRIEKDGTTLVVDPGGLTAPGALDGADAVFITHEHFDHFDEGALRAALDASPRLRVWTNGATAAKLEGLGGRVTVVGHGDAFDVNGIGVEVHGEWHAVIHPDIPRIGNVGFLIDGSVFHPGDAFTAPERPVDALMVPISGPWQKPAEVIDYVRAVKPARAFSVHDEVLSDIGKTVVNGLLGANGPGTGTAYERFSPGDTVEL